MLLWLWKWNNWLWHASKTQVITPPDLPHAKTVSKRLELSINEISKEKVCSSQWQFNFWLVQQDVKNGSRAKLSYKPPSDERNLDELNISAPDPIQLDAITGILKRKSLQKWCESLLKIHKNEWWYWETNNSESDGPSGSMI